MSNIYVTYFAILRDYFWSQTPITHVDWSSMMQISARQGTLPLLADYALKQSGEEAPSAEIKMQLKQLALRNMLHQQRLKGYLKMVKDCLDAAAIPFVLLKGYGLAALYPNPEVRSSSDVDIWVGRENFQRAISVLKQLPDVVTYEEQEADNVRHFNLHWENEQYVVEVHPVSYSFVSPCEKSRYYELEQAGLHHTPYTVHRTPSTIHHPPYTVHHTSYTTIDGISYPVPTAEFNAMYVFLHMFGDYQSKGCTIKQLIDWMLVLHQLYTLHPTPYTVPHTPYTVSCTPYTIEKDLRLFHLTEPWRVFGWIVVNYLGLAKEEMPLYDESPIIVQKSMILLKDIMTGNVSHHPHREYGKKGLVHKLEVLRDAWWKYQDTRTMFPDYARHTFMNMIKKGLKIYG